MERGFKDRTPTEIAQRADRLADVRGRSGLPAIDERTLTNYRRGLKDGKFLDGAELHGMPDGTWTSYYHRQVPRLADRDGSPLRRGGAPSRQRRTAFGGRRHPP